MNHESNVSVNFPQSFGLHLVFFVIITIIIVKSTRNARKDCLGS
jgi:hypothetical protein